MKEELRVLYAEGVASHGGPESCAAAREGGGEALTGVRVGRVIEPRNQQVRGADAVRLAEGNTAGGVRRESLVGPARSEIHGMCGAFMRENREVPYPPDRLIAGWVAAGTLRR
jgi:RNA-directed DNA polymerase